MATQTAALKYANNLNYGAQTAEAGSYVNPRLTPSAIPVAQTRPSASARMAVKTRYGLSLFAITGSLFVAVLMIFVILAYVSLSEISRETVRLQSRYAELKEKERRLNIEYEQVFSVGEVERYATDVLGMTKPDSGQIAVMEVVPSDRAEILDGESEDESALGGFGSFISSLLTYFK